MKLVCFKFRKICIINESIKKKIVIFLVKFLLPGDFLFINKEKDAKTRIIAILLN